MERRSLLSASFGVGRVLGIPIRLHLTFLVLVGWLVWEASRQGREAIPELVLVLLLFVFVVLHELGHAMMALLCDVRTSEIVLLPIGGLARLERMPTGARELAIALAGPSVNLALALFFAAIGLVFFDLPAVTDLEASGVPLVIWGAVFMNVALTGFNLLPAFPMDGGRVLRAVLTFFLPIEQATRWAARVGQALALCFAVLGLASGNLLLVVIAALVFFGAAQEALFYSGRSRLQGRAAAEAMITRFDTVAPQASLREAARLLLATDQDVFPVVDAWGRLAGVLPRVGLLGGLSRFGPEAAVLEVMYRDFPTAARESPLEEVLDKLQNVQRLPVFILDRSRLVGIVTRQNLGELLELARLMPPTT